MDLDAFMEDEAEIEQYVRFGFDTRRTASEASYDYYRQWDDEAFLALHPFSLSCEGIWDSDVYMWFTEDEYYEARMDV